MENKNNIKEIQLYSSGDEIKISQITSVLKENNIPYIRKDDGSGSYMNIYMGTSIQEKRIFVKEEDFIKASQLISSIISKDSICNNIEDSDEEKYKFFAHLLGYMFLICILIIPIILLIAFINIVY